MSDLVGVIAVVVFILLVFALAFIYAPWKRRQNILAMGKEPGIQVLGKGEGKRGSVATHQRLYGVQRGDSTFEITGIRQNIPNVALKGNKMILKNSYEIKTFYKHPNGTPEHVVLYPAHQGGYDAFHNPITGRLGIADTVLSALVSVTLNYPTIVDMPIDYRGALEGTDYNVYGESPAAMELMNSTIQSAIMKWNNKNIRNYDRRPPLIFSPQGTLILWPIRETRRDKVLEILDTGDLIAGSL